LEKVIMRRLALLAFPLLAASLVACSDDDSRPTDTQSEAYVCGPGVAGDTLAAPTCHLDPKAQDPNAAAVEAFRTHAIEASSASGGAARFASGVLVGVSECIGRIIGAAMGNAIVAAFGGKPDETPITCDDVYDDSSKATFESGTYTMLARQRGGSPNAPWRLDTNSTATIKVFLARDAGHLKKGDLVTVDVQKVDSFLVHARIVTTADGKSAVAFDALGPLAGLLGLDETSPNPAPLTTKMRDGLANAFELEGSVHADLADCAGGYHSIIDQSIPRTPASQELRPRLISARTTSPNGTEVTAKTWDVAFTGLTARGRIDADVTGPGTVHHAQIDMASSDEVSGTLTLDCAP
jgi:hypothetical protein